MQNTLMRRLGLAERTWFLLALIFSALIGNFFERGQIALLLYLLVPWGAGLLYVRLKGRALRRGAANAFLFAGMAWMALVCLLRQCFDLNRWLPLALVTLYALAASQPQPGQSAAARQSELRAVAALIVACVTPMMLLAVVSVFLGRPIPFLHESRPIGISADGGFSERIRVLIHPNGTARAAVVAALMAIYLIMVARRRWAKALCGVCIAILTLAIVHAQSRTSNIAYGAALGALAFRGVWLRMEGRRGRAAVGIAVWAAVALTVVVVLGRIFTLDVWIAQSLAGQQETAAVSRAVTDGAVDVFSNGRDEIWREALRYMRARPVTFLLGLGSGEIQSVVMDSASWTSTVYTLHNSFVDCLVRGGIPFLLCMLGYLCMLVRPALRALTGAEDAQHRGEAVPAILVGALLLISLTEVTIFLSASFVNCVFFLAAGHLLEMDAARKDAPAASICADKFDLCIARRNDMQKARSDICENIRARFFRSGIRRVC